MQLARKQLHVLSSKQHAVIRLRSPKSLTEADDRTPSKAEGYNHV